MNFITQSEPKLQPKLFFNRSVAPVKNIRWRVKPPKPNLNDKDIPLHLLENKSIYLGPKSDLNEPVFWANFKKPGKKHDQSMISTNMSKSSSVKTVRPSS